jgi:hypothetical protein
VSTPADDGLDQLYAAPLVDFVKVRDRHAADLRKQGDKARAAEVKALSKPTPAAWAVNQVARTAPQAVQRLLEASDRMARLQLRAADPEARRRFEQATTEHRQTLGELVEQASAALGEAGQTATPAVLERVSNNLRWGALDDDARPLLQRGRLQRDLAPAGFGAFTSDDDAEGEEEPTIDLGRALAPRAAPPGPPAASRPTTAPPPAAGRPASATPPARGAPAERTPPPAARTPAAPRINSGTLRLRLRESDQRIKQIERELERHAEAVRTARAALDDLERRASSARQTLRAAEAAQSEAQDRLAQEESSRGEVADALQQVLHGDDDSAELAPANDTSNRPAARPPDPGKRGR